jgi:HEAT repeat protein
MEAVAAINETKDLQRVPALIEMLDDPDPGIRLAAHRTLQDLTGRESAYRPWADPEELRAAVVDWRRWWAAR